jgi:thiamine pyrophosphokinase
MRLTEPYSAFFLKTIPPFFLMLSRFLLPGGKDYVLIILNQPLLPFELLSRLFSNPACVTRIVADGGSNRLMQIQEKQEGDPEAILIPDLICGDLDSINADTREYYTRLGVRIRLETSQDNTGISTLNLEADFQKCINAIPKGHERADILAIGALGGRLDQSMASINVM